MVLDVLLEIKNIAISLQFKPGSAGERVVPD